MVLFMVLWFTMVLRISFPDLFTHSQLTTALIVLKVEGSGHMEEGHPPGSSGSSQAALLGNMFWRSMR